MNILYQNANQRVFGTFPLKGEELARAVAAAVKSGYRGFDTAQMYANEADLGVVLKDLRLPRDQVCIITKVNPSHYDRDKFLPSVEQSLTDLQVSYSDVLLLHWPPIGGQIDSPLKHLAEAQARGLTKHIGVSNFTAHMMRHAQTVIDTPIITNQVEFHPLLDQSVLLAAAAETGIPLMSYCSLARGEVFKHDILTDIAEGYGKLPGQIVLRWILQKGVVANTMSTNPTNIHNNFHVMDFTLSSVDMARIDQLGKLGHRIITKDMAPWAPKWD